MTRAMVADAGRFGESARSRFFTAREPAVAITPEPVRPRTAMVPTALAGVFKRVRVCAEVRP